MHLESQHLQLYQARNIIETGLQRSRAKIGISTHVAVVLILLLFSTMCDDSDFAKNLSKYRCRIARSVHFKLTSNSRAPATLANSIQSK